MKEFAKARQVMKIYYPLTKGWRHLGAASIVLYVIGGLFLDIVGPYLIKILIDNLTDTSINVWYILLFILVNTLLFRVIFYLSARLTIKFEYNVMKRIEDEAFNNLSQRSYNFYVNEFSGGLVAKTSRFVRAFEGLFDSLTTIFIPAAMNVVAVIVVLFYENWLLGLVFFIWSIIHLTINIILIRKKLTYSEINAAKQSLTTAQLSDFLTNAITALSFGSRKLERKLFSEKLSDLKKARKKDWRFTIDMVNGLQLSVNILSVLSIGVGVYLWSLDLITVGSIVLIISYTSVMFRWMLMLSRSIDRSTSLIADAIEMSEIMDREIEIVDSGNARELKINSGEIEFENVSFRYDDKSSKVFENFDLKVKPGESIGLVGPSGGGKSTITKLLLRFVDVQSGAIKIDDQDIREVKQESLRQSIAYVPQEPLLFHRSIKENIAYGKPEATLQEIIEAAQKARAHEFITKLPNGYETLVGERGVKLSGGQRQRIAIARAILKNSAILVLDEATSSLDSKSERDIQKAIINLIKGKTVIAIAHRLSTIKNLDRIIVLDQGKIVEEGTHDELLGKKGMYYDLWQHQYGGFIGE